MIQQTMRLDQKYVQMYFYHILHLCQHVALLYANLHQMYHSMLIKIRVYNRDYANDIATILRRRKK